MQISPDLPVVIIGAGPAGLTAAYELSRERIPHVVLEQDAVVGGISRTVNYKGFLFDIGGHRFFTKVDAVDRLWKAILSREEFPVRKRLSRIYYDRKFFAYPLQPFNALMGLGAWNCCRVVLSYIRSQLSPEEPETNLEQWVSNRFGRQLYRIFFKSYTEKVWGIPCTEISADWAAQRIKGLSLAEAIKNAFVPPSTGDKHKAIKTLINAFEYPLRGPGMMWERIADLVTRSGGTIMMNTTVCRIHHADARVRSVEVRREGGARDRIEGSHFVSSMPLRDLILNMDPEAPPSVRQAAGQLCYRDFLTVAVIVDRAEVFPDNWIYIHAEDVKVGRIQNFNNWSPHMVPHPGQTCLGLEYFCREGDDLWSMADHELVELAGRELDRLKLVKTGDIRDGAVVRMPKAYPVYHRNYRAALDPIRAYLATFENLQVVGRNGMHHYNNQDHSMLTAMLAVKNMMGANHDLWHVNTEEAYHEEVRDGDEGGIGGLRTGSA